MTKEDFRMWAQSTLQVLELRKVYQFSDRAWFHRMADVAAEHDPELAKLLRESSEKMRTATGDVIAYLTKRLRG